MRTILLTLCLSVFLLGGANAADNEAQFGDWGKVCDKGADKKESCYMVQTATNSEKGTLIMQLRIGLSPTTPDPIVIATLPLGAMLPSGALLTVDTKDAPTVKMPFLTCVKEGCSTIGQRLSPEMIKAMKKSNKGAIRIALLNKKIVGLPVSLKGFTAALKSITK